MSGRKNKRKRRADRSRKNTNNNKQEDCLSASSSPTNNKKRRRAEDSTKPPNMSFETCVVVFQDAIESYLQNNCSNNNNHHPGEHDGSEENDNGVSLAFFDLANAPFVGYRIRESQTNHKKENSKKMIQVKQDISACGKHTGGIVWETSYLLLQYLLATQQQKHQQQPKLGKTLEVGAGCGLLGQVIAAHQLAKKVVMTEIKQVMDNLQANVERNKELLLKLQEKKKKTCLHVLDLDWEQVERDAKKEPEHLKPHSFDTILGTDVVFTPKLVEPLWKTLQYMSHPETNIYLCLQERCAASHKLLLEKAPDYHFQIQDITPDLEDIESCQWGSSLECRMFHITRLRGEEETKR